MTDAITITGPLAARLRAVADAADLPVEAVLEDALDTTTRAAFFDLSLDLFCVLDGNGRIWQANRILASVFATVPEALSGKPFAGFVYVGDRESAAAAVCGAATDRETTTLMCRFVNSDDTMRFYLWTLHPLAGGQVCAIGRDITPFREMELREDERNIFAEALLDTVIAINSNLSLGQVLERILSNVGRVVAYDYVNLMLINGDEAEIVGGRPAAAARVSADYLQGARFTIPHDEHLAYMYEARQSLIVPSIQRPPPWMVTASLGAPGSFLGAPVIVEEAVIGFLGVFNCDEDFFTPLHAQQLNMFANQAGITINNARLYEQAQTAAVLRERQRVAQELHDSVNQNLFAASTYADLLPRAIERKPEAVPQYAADISRLIRGAVAQMRMILIELHPEALLSTDMGALLRQLCDAFSAQTGVPVAFSANRKAVLAREEQITVYRVAQEALHNIDKHAKADRVRVQLDVGDDRLALHIHDDGIGFDPSARHELHFGVNSMRERAAAVGGALEILSGPADGTTVHFFKDY